MAPSRQSTSPLVFVSAGAGQDCDFSGDIRRNPASEEVERNIKKVRCTKKKREGTHKWQRNNDGRNERRKLALVRRHSVCATYLSVSASILIDRTCTLGESKQQFAIGDESRRLDVARMQICTVIADAPPPWKGTGQASTLATLI